MKNKNKNKNKIDPKIVKQAQEFAARQFQGNIKRLGFDDESSYFEWCLQNSFSTSRNKTQRDFDKEFKYKQRLKSEQILKASRKTRNDSEVLEGIFKGELTPKDFSSGQQFWINIWQSFEIFKRPYHENSSQSQFYFDLLHYLIQKSTFWKENILIAGINSNYIQGLVCICTYSAFWIRDYKDWKPKSHNARRQFSSLVRHLFAKYDVPDFLDYVWFNGSASNPKWFWHIGQGGNIRTLETPVPVTKKIAHFFLQAPDGYTIDFALRYGQILSMNGDARLADAITHTAIANNFNNDDFWITVFKFLIQNPMFDRRQVSPLIDYLINQRFMHQEIVVEGQTRVIPPPEPGLTMKNRDPVVLLERVQKWHERLARLKVKKEGVIWQPSGIRSFKLEFGDKEKGTQRTWTIRELLTQKELIAEGRVMHHCAASYFSSCYRGLCSIWSLEFQRQHEEVEKVLTIEVSRSKAINQARGKYNELPNSEQAGILNRWALSAGLSYRI